MFKNQQQSGFLLGLVLIVISLLIHFLSIVSEIFFLSGFSIVLLVLGISLFLYGKYVTKIILFPILFLAFMFPLPIVVINSFSLPLKMFVTKSSVFVLKNIFNIPLSNKGFQIFFPYSRLTVENPCSGLRSLIALLAIGSIFGYLLKASMKKRIILFLLAIPVALFSNLIRVILLSLGVYIYGNKMATGFFHDFTGYLVFVIAFFSLMLLAEYLRCKN
jgi:exosortase